MPLNQQPVERQDLSRDGSLDLHSIFVTLQGEGPFAGKRSVFVRLAGCNLMCPGCDTEYTEGRRRVQIAALIRELGVLTEGWDEPLIVITGGEPLRQNLDELCVNLEFCGYRIQIETNGVFGPSPKLMELMQDDSVAVIVSPKTSRIHKDWSEWAYAFKYVLQYGEVDADRLPLRALGHKAAPRVARPGPNYRGPIYVNPMDEKDPIANIRNLNLVARAALNHGYIAGVQMHKLMNLE
jgi:7-carboxy-7-deazaguanine synthase